MLKGVTSQLKNFVDLKSVAKELKSFRYERVRIDWVINIIKFDVICLQIYLKDLGAQILLDFLT